MSKRTSVGVILLAAAAVVACNGFGPRVCTQIGCESGLTVELQGTAAGTFTVTATAASGESQSVTCSEGSQCRLFFLDLISSRVTITYESEGQILEQTFSPEYRRTRPNGQDCPPECLNATIVLDVEP